MRTVGYLSGGAGAGELAAHLAKLGYGEGRNLRFVTRSVHDVDGPASRALAAEVVAARPDALLAFTGVRTRLLSELTREIPIVTGGVGDPVGHGLARSLARPGGNVTGLSMDFPGTVGIWLGVLRAFVPRLARIVMVVSPQMVVADDVGDLIRRTREAGVASEVQKASAPADVARALDAIQDPAMEVASIGGMAFSFDPSAMAAMARERRVVAMWFNEELIEHGGLVGYWRSHSRRFDRIAAILAKVLDGADPGGIPFELPDVTRCTVNPAAARAIGIRIPDEVMLRATRVIG